MRGEPDGKRSFDSTIRSIMSHPDRLSSDSLPSQREPVPPDSDKKYRLRFLTDMGLRDRSPMYILILNDLIPLPRVH